MRLSAKRVEALRVLLKQQTGRDYSGEELQQAGLAIMRFVIAKYRRNEQLTNNKELNDGKSQKDTRETI